VQDHILAYGVCHGAHKSLWFNFLVITQTRPYT